MKSIAYLFYLSAVCSLVSLFWINKPILITYLFMFIGILPVAAYFIKTFNHNPIRKFLFIYLCLGIIGIGLSIYESNTPQWWDDQKYQIIRNVFYLVNHIYTLIFCYFILRLVKRFSFLWWAIIGVIVAIILQHTIPHLPFWFDYLSYSDFADRYPIFGRMLFSYIFGIAYIVLKISIGNALMPKSLKNI